MSEPHQFHRARLTGHKRLLLALLLGSAGALSASVEAFESIIDLGVDVSPADISNNGTIVGSRQTEAGTIGFRRLEDGTWQDFPGTTAAHAVNDLGQVAGTTLTGAFRLDGTLKEWDGYAAYGLSEAGQIAGNKQLKNPYRPTPVPLDPAVYTPSKWDNLDVATVYSRGTRQGVYADLYTLTDINDNGFGVGVWRRYGLSGSSSILTTPGLDAVTHLPVPYGGTAAAINNQNMIVGTTGSSSSTNEYARAYLYDYDNDNLIDLGTLNGGLTSSAADINELNQVVGSSWLVQQLTSASDPTQYHAFLWQPCQMTDPNECPMTDLNTVIPADSPVWILTAATAINDNGDIVGTGLLGGQVHGFLLSNSQSPTPPTGTPQAGQPPVAVASADVTAGKVPLTVNFSAADPNAYDPDGQSIVYHWDFGDGNSGITEANPTHTYTAPGTYIAVLTVTNAQGLTARNQVEIKARKSRGKR